MISSTDAKEAPKGCSYVVDFKNQLQLPHSSVFQQLSTCNYKAIDYTYNITTLTLLCHAHCTYRTASFAKLVFSCTVHLETLEKLFGNNGPSSS